VITVPVWLLVLTAIGMSMVACVLIFALLVWLSGRLDKQVADLDFDAHARQAIDLSDGT